MVDLGTYRLVLASKSPRRQELLKALGFSFELRTKEVDESFPDHLRGAEIAEYLAAIKASAFLSDLAEDEILVTADTIVCLDDCVFNKPADADEAFAMIKALSGRAHEVITGVSVSTTNTQEVFHDTTRVHFAELDDAEIRYYIETFRPYDKAGAYGIQEWIGYMGIDAIEGSFYNVVGFPTRKFYATLKTLLKP